MALKWTRTKPEPPKHFEQELNPNPNRYLKRFDTLVQAHKNFSVSFEIERWGPDSLLLFAFLLRYNNGNP